MEFEMVEGIKISDLKDLGRVLLFLFPFGRRYK
jgi:hypothetical protein